MTELRGGKCVTQSSLPASIASHPKNISSILLKILIQIRFKKIFQSNINILQYKILIDLPGPNAMKNWIFAKRHLLKLIVATQIKSSCVPQKASHSQGIGRGQSLMIIQVCGCGCFDGWCVVYLEILFNNLSL